MSHAKEILNQTVKQRLQQIQKFIKSVNQCPLCAEPLSLIHEMDNTKNEILETAHCSECNLDVRKKKHHKH